ncbi:HNH endonuclease signature motif containing protein [Jatrophihabitans fulvus]
MTAIAPSFPAAQAVATVRAAVDGLLAADFTGCDAAEFLALVDDLEVEARRWAAVDARVVAELKDRYLAGQLGRTSVADVLKVRLRVSPGEARARQLRAEDLGPRRQLTGEVLSPLVEDTAAALRAGEISGAHASVITRALDRLPDTGDPAVPDIVQFHLLSAARQTDPATLRQLADQLLAHLLPERKPRTERRGITLSPRVGGLRAIRGEVTDELAALLEVVFDALAAPNPATEQADGTVQRDDRTAANRRHDAVLEVFKRVLRSGTLPDSGGVPATLIITAGLDELARRGATVRTSHGELITLEQVLAMAGDLAVELCITDDTDDTDDTGNATEDTGNATEDGQADDTCLADEAVGRCTSPDGGCDQLGEDAGVGHGRTLRQLLNRLFARKPGQGAVLAHGRTRRNATGTQRKVIAGRDGAGCCFPGCTRPLAWTQAHHIVRWEDGGRTDIDNMCLVCVFHHQLLDRGDWSVRMADDGRPEWIPPRLLDPQRRPVRNYAHHPPDVRFRPVLVRLN